MGLFGGRGVCLDFGKPCVAGAAFPQRLKPGLLIGLNGMAEAMPLRKKSRFRAMGAALPLGGV